MQSIVAASSATDLFTNIHQISQAAHVIELFHSSRKIVFVEDWIRSKLNLESKSEDWPDKQVADLSQRGRISVQFQEEIQAPAPFLQVACKDQYWYQYWPAKINLGILNLFSFQVSNVQRMLLQETCGTGEHAYVFTAWS